MGDTIRLGIDINSAPVPPRRYAADICSVVNGGKDVKIIFGQENLGEGPLESAIVIRLSYVAVQWFVNSVAEMNSPSLEEILEGMNLDPEVLSTVNERPFQTANLVANFAAVGVSGFETCMDFYHASPFAMRALPGRNNLEVEPVVRVDLRTSLFASLVTELNQIALQLPTLE